MLKNENKFNKAPVLERNMIVAERKLGFESTVGFTIWELVFNLGTGYLWFE